MCQCFSIKNLSRIFEFFKRPDANSYFFSLNGMPPPFPPRKVDMVELLPFPYKSRLFAQQTGQIGSSFL